MSVCQLGLKLGAIDVNVDIEACARSGGSFATSQMFIAHINLTTYIQTLAHLRHRETLRSLTVAITPVVTIDRVQHLAAPPVIVTLVPQVTAALGNVQNLTIWTMIPTKRCLILARSCLGAAMLRILGQSEVHGDIPADAVVQ